MIERFHFWFNVIEAGIWIVLAGWFLFLALKRQSSLKKTFLVFSVTLFFFGISDLIETQTGAWYKPFSLFMMKAVCVLFIAGCLVVLFRNRAECERVMNGKEDSKTKD
jgi:glycerol-3-phosphate acyltransferase PlsY